MTYLNEYLQRLLRLSKYVGIASRNFLRPLFGIEYTAFRTECMESVRGANKWHSPQAGLRLPLNLMRFGNSIAASIHCGMKPIEADVMIVGHVQSATISSRGMGRQ
jgi:hypothetical protein